MILADTCTSEIYSLLSPPTNSSFVGVTNMDRYRQEFNPGYNYVLPCHILDTDDVGTQPSAQRMTTKQPIACIL